MCRVDTDGHLLSREDGARDPARRVARQQADSMVVKNLAVVHHQPAHVQQLETYAAVGGALTLVRRCMITNRARSKRSLHTNVQRKV